MKPTSHILTSVAVMVAGLFLAPNAVRADPPLPGAIFTTDSTCTDVNQNIYDNKEDVYIDGGPAHPGAAGLPDGTYCVQVTDPSGQTVLGKSDPGAVTVVGGQFVQCYQLTSILKTGSSGFTVPGFDDTPNPGGEYKVWVSTDCNFDNNSTKTDNFQVDNTNPTPTPTPTATPTATPTPTPCPKGWICFKSFYDANANGVQDNGEPEMVGWQFSVFAHNNLQIRRETPLCTYVMVGTYRALERAPNELNWVHTTPIDVEFDVDTDYTENVAFGTACIGAGGGLTIGYWSNTGGQLETRGDFQTLTALNLVTAQGTAQDFTGTAAQMKASLKQFLLGANTTNMANMLSAELATMKLNVLHGFVNGTALIYAPGLSACGMSGSSSRGFTSINDLMTAANQSLLDHPLTQNGSPDRACQEALKNALDDANNNKSFVQSSPCTFTFGD
jgi:hypothetical protein